MALPRPSCLRGTLGRSTLRKAGSHTRSNTFRQAGRRTYASGHEAKQSSDLPWAIGSIVVTVPAATWLWGQGPSKQDHGHHGHETEAKVVDEGDENHSQEKEEGGDDNKEVSKDDESNGKDEPESADKSEEAKEEGKDDGKSDESGSEGDGKETPETSDDEEYDKPGVNAPGQISKIGQSKGQKPRAATEKKGEKDAAKDHSGANHPYIDDSSKSKKMEGVAETAKIHGTVDPRRNSSNPSD